MKLPYGYVLIGKEIVIHEEKADVVRSIFDDYLAGASLGKIVDLLFKKGVVSPTGKVKWTRAAVDKLLANKKYIPLVGIKIYMDTQFEKARRCNVDYPTLLISRSWKPLFSMAWRPLPKPSLRMKSPTAVWRLRPILLTWKRQSSS